MKTFELCYLGFTTSHRFRVTQVTEDGNVLDGAWGDLYFKKPILKGLWIGAYCTADTDDETTFKSWKQIPKANAPLDQNIITEFSIENRARLAKANALKFAKVATRDMDALIKEMRECMFMLDRSEKAAFAMYVYQMLSK
jgi:hypothetical protein